jgi:hypothetical protein
MREFQPADYGPVLAPLVSGERCRPLDGGQPDPSVRGALELATVNAAFAQTPVADRDMAACCIAGLWLMHDFLDQSHRISQTIETPSGAFWHGVMHRREGDFSNAKYWFRRVGDHEVLGELAEGAAELGHDAESFELGSRVAPGGAFDPFAFVDACQAALATGGASADFCRRLQQAEWELLFDHCYRHAVAA